MKKIQLLLGFFAISFLGHSQVNLVPNPSFENYSVCPDNLNQLSRCNNWFNPTGGSPDYYNSCSSSLFANIPQNTYGYQTERTGGNAYVGISLFNLSPNEREYVEVELTNSLIAGKKYCVTFYYSFADLAELVSSRIGIYFSTDSVLGTFADNLPNTPQIENNYNNFLRDSVNWIAVSRVYTAVGGEKFLTLGNFHNDATTDTSRVNSGIFNNSYYYIDDVSLVEMTVDYASAGNDMILCNGASVTLGAPAVSGCTYQWQAPPEGGLSDPSSAQPTATPTQTTTYILSVTDNSTGTLCNYTTTDSVTITVRNDCASDAPNVFTPNGDNKNDFFRIDNLPPSSHLVVFNRWGVEVFSSSSYDNKWNGGDLNSGVYYYLLTFPDKTMKKGFVEIIK